MGSLIIYCNPVWEVKTSVLEPSYLVVSLLYKRFNLVAKSSRTTDYLPKFKHLQLYKTAQNRIE